jgi:hypothetical protein
LFVSAGIGAFVQLSLHEMAPTRSNVGFISDKYRSLRALLQER